MTHMKPTSLHRPASFQLWLNPNHLQICFSVKFVSQDIRPCLFHLDCSRIIFGFASVANLICRISFATKVHFKVLQQITLTMSQIEIQLHWRSWFEITVCFRFHIQFHWQSWFKIAICFIFQIQLRWQSWIWFLKLKQRGPKFLVFIWFSRNNLHVRWHTKNLIRNVACTFDEEEVIKEITYFLNYMTVV